jgi:hypothetical protein
VPFVLVERKLEIIPPGLGPPKVVTLLQGRVVGLTHALGQRTSRQTRRPAISSMHID